MIPVVTADKMREIDRATIETLGLPSLVLMERAGLSVAKRILKYDERPERIVIFSGGGNNGGDGIVIGRELHNRGFNVKLYLLSPPERLSPDCRKEFEIAKKYRLNISTSPPRSARSLEGCVIIDAILGTGLNKPLTDKINRVVNMINQSGSPVFSVDIPTGISSDTGEVMGNAVMADVTVTFGLPKRGHILPPGSEYTGRLFIEDIGFPSFLTDDAAYNTLLLEEEDAGELIPYRPKDSYKGTYGHLLVVGGSMGKTGALMLSGRAALRTGSGLVTLSSDAETIHSIAPSILEEMTLPLQFSGGDYIRPLDDVLSFLDERADVIAIGPGLGRDDLKRRFVLELIKEVRKPIVIDADALHHLSTLSEKELERLFSNLKAPAVLTPHHGEMMKLLKRAPDSLKRDPIETARGFATSTATLLVLKGAPTIIASPEGGVFINSTGNPGMATAGSGDVLTGMIGSLIGQSLAPLEASLLGVYLHGLAGDIASEELSPQSLLAGDIIEHIPDAYNTLTSPRQFRS